MPAGQWLREERTRRGLSEHTLAEFVEAPVALIRAHEHDDPPMSWNRAYEYQLAFQRYDEYVAQEGAS